MKGTEILQISSRLSCPTFLFTFFTWYASNYNSEKTSHDNGLFDLYSVLPTNRKNEEKKKEGGGYNQNDIEGLPENKIWESTMRKAMGTRVVLK